MPVDISAFGLAVGQTFTVQHAMDFYGAPVASGAYTGAAVLFPMTNLPIAQPINAVQPVGPFPRFAAFVVLPGPDKTPTPAPASAGIAHSGLLPAVRGHELAGRPDIGQGGAARSVRTCRSRRNCRTSRRIWFAELVADFRGMIRR